MKKLQTYEQNLPTWKNKKHVLSLFQRKTYVFSLWSCKVNEITSSNLLSALQPIWNLRQHEIRQRIGVVLKWCIANEWRTDNPADNISEGLPKHPKKKIIERVFPTLKSNFITSLKDYSSNLYLNLL